MKTVIYGLGEVFDLWSMNKDFLLDDVVALADKNTNIIGKNKFGYQVISPREMLKVPFDKVIVTTPKYYSEIKDELIALGIDGDKISLLDFKPYKVDGELLYWSNIYEAEGGCFSNGHYRNLFLGIACEDSDSFMEDKVVVDFGCGPRGSLAWTGKPKIKIGCDVLVNKYMDHFGDGMKNHGMVYVNTDEKNIPLPTGYVDILSTINSLDHVAYLDQMISELFRIMKPGALFLGSFNLNEPCSLEEPQTFTLESLEEKLFSHLEIIDKRMAIKDPERAYKNIESGELVSRLEPNQFGVLWVKARKK